MSTYVMSDIHGCYTLFINMLKKINFTAEDVLILAGDCIDRGPQSYEMINWLLNRPVNVICLKGNHEEEFAYAVELMSALFEKNELSDESLGDTKIARAILKQASSGVFDYYHTIKDLIEDHEYTLSDLKRFSDLIGEMPYLYKQTIGGKQLVVVHAGYIDNLKMANTKRNYESIEEFYLYAREDAYIYGGVQSGIIVAGHTPTHMESEMQFNNGYVYKLYNEELDCLFLDIDCGCSYGYSNSKLACVRIEDGKIFYV